MTLEAGTRVGKYEIRQLLGAGGMGEVYLAQDAELRRPVALKFLPAEVAADPRRLERFGREALAASALNHPNIVTVYDIGQTRDGRRFIATEFVDGATLRERQKTHRLRLTDTLDIVAQAAAALVEAHGQGIVHRDIKPENVMVRRDGYVKVLDFGLAKLTGGPAAGGVDTEAATRALAPTGAGTVLGTVSYMSPEQSRGEEVDARTDVWSLGVVLYELLTGHLPFRGKSASHIIVAIQDAEPPPLSAHLPEVPDLLQEVVSDALAKDREARLTTRQMLAKLQRLKRRVDAGEHLDHSVPPVATSPGLEGNGGHPATFSQAGPTASGAHATRVGLTATQPTLPGVGAHAGARRVWLFAGLGAVAFAALLLAGLGFVVYRYARSSQAPPPPDARASMKIKSLTDSGRASEAVISPDGRLVYASRAGGYFDIWLMNADGGAPRQLTSGTDANNFPSVSPDGRYVVFETNRGVGWSLWRMNLDGGAQKELTRNTGQFSRPQVSADGRRVYYAGPDLSGRLVTWRVNLDGGEPEQLTRKETGAARLSPDGQLLLYYHRERPEAPARIEVAPAAGGEPVRALDSPRDTRDADWAPDGRALVVVKDVENVSNLWTLPLEGGRPRQLTDWKSDRIFWYAWSRDGRQLAVARGDTFYDVMLIKDFR